MQLSGTLSRSYHAQIVQNSSRKGLTSCADPAILPESRKTVIRTYPAMACHYEGQGSSVTLSRINSLSSFG
jgi:hypothetical protein